MFFMIKISAGIRDRGQQLHSLVRRLLHRDVRPGHLRPAQRQHHGQAERPPLPHRLRKVPRRRANVRELPEGSDPVRFDTR